jgi:hypothetical protein
LRFWVGAGPTRRRSVRGRQIRQATEHMTCANRTISVRTVATSDSDGAMCGWGATHALPLTAPSVTRMRVPRGGRERDARYRRSCPWQPHCVVPQQIRGQSDTGGRQYSLLAPGWAASRRRPSGRPSSPPWAYGARRRYSGRIQRAPATIRPRRRTHHGCSTCWR